MDAFRRATLKAAGAAFLLASGLLHPLRALAVGWNKAAFASKTPADALKSIGAPSPLESKDLLIVAPQIAENGAAVPIEVTSNVPNTKSIAVIVEKNLFPLIAQFEFMEGALPFLRINVKMGESSWVRVVAEAGGRHYSAAREIKITIGGCGG